MMDLAFKKEPIEHTYTIGENIGSGKFAVVKVCHHKETGQRYAAKFIKKKRSTTSRMGARSEDIQNEVRSLRALDHEHIIKLYDAFETRTEAILILELVQGGELFTYLSERQGVTEEEATIFIKQILKAVQAMHSVHIAHLDIKPENVMLESPHHHAIKIIDFGISRELCPGSEVRDMIGTPEFVAPEIVNYEPLHLSTDMWSIGVVTYILLSGASPFLGSTYQQTYENVSLVDFCLDNEYFSETSELAKDFIKRLLLRNPAHRMTAVEALNHPWIEPRREEQRRLKRISSVRTENLRSFIARKRWRQSFRIIRLCNELVRNHQSSLRAVGETNKPDLDTRSQAAFTEVKGAYLLTGLSVVLQLPVVYPNRSKHLKSLLEAAAARHVDVNTFNTKGTALVHTAAASGHVPTLELLRDSGASLDLADNTGFRPLDYASELGHLSEVQFLTQHGFLDVCHKTQAGDTCLHLACRHNHPHIVKFICSQTSNQNIDDMEKLMTDHENNHCNGVTHSLSDAPSIPVHLDCKDQFGETSLHLATWNDNTSMVECLLRSGATINTLNKDEETALHVACARGCNSNIIELLVNSGVDVNLRNKNGESAIFSVHSIHSPLCLNLVKLGADPQSTNKKGDSLLHLSASSGHLELAEELVKQDVPLNLPNKVGHTPLSLAITNLHIELVRYLLLLGARLEPAYLQMLTPPLNHETMSETDLHAAEKINELLHIVSDQATRNTYQQNLATPASSNCRRQTLVLLGSRGSGKSTVLSALKAGYMARASSFVKSFASNYISSPISKAHVNGLQPPTDTDKHITIQPVVFRGKTHFLCQEVPENDQYAHVYSALIGKPHAIHILTFDVTHCDKSDSRAEKEVRKWLGLLKSLVRSTSGPIYEDGENGICLPVMLVGTHFDHANESQIMAANILHLNVKVDYAADLAICGQLFVINATTPHSQPVSALKQYLKEFKGRMEKEVTLLSMSVESVFSYLSEWRGQYEPIIYLSELQGLIRRQINPLAMDQHVTQAIKIMEASHEILILHSDGLDSLVVLQPNFLYSTLLPQILCYTFRSSCPASGFLPATQLSSLIPNADYDILSACICYLNLACSTVGPDGAPGLEFPSLNFLPKTKISKPSTLTTLLFKLIDDDRCALSVIFYQSLLSLRKMYILERSHCAESDESTQLHFHMNTAEYMHTGVTLYITLENDQIVMSTCGEPSSATLLLLEMLQIITYLQQNVCPAETLQIALQLPNQQVIDCYNLFSISPQQLSLTKQVVTKLLPNTPSITLCPDVPVGSLSTLCRRRLAAALDQPDELGRDWCLLAMQLEMEPVVPKIEEGKDQRHLSKSSLLINYWLKTYSQDEQPTAGYLYDVFRHIGRVDCAEILVHYTPLISVENPII